VYDVNFPTTFREPLWVPSSLVMSHSVTEHLAPLLLYSPNHDLVISVFPSVRPSLCMEQFGSHWTDSDEMWYSNVFRKSAEKIQVLLKYDKNIRYFT
jgi:hypothetical protein